MAQRGGDRGRRWRAHVAAAAMVLVLAGCTDESGPEPDLPPEPTALRVSSVHGTEGLEQGRTVELEAAVGDVLSDYVVGGFLGDYPREDFVSAFDAFTAGAARRAVEDIDVLTAAGFADARGVTATALDARLSFLSDGADVTGATAHVDFRFEVTDADGVTQPLTLTGRMMLARQGEVWSVFGYDVARGGADPVETEAAS